MRAVVQCVSEASVSVEGNVVGRIGRGYLILLGVGHGDGEAQAQRLWEKIRKMRVFEDESGKTNLSLADVGGVVLVDSQYPLFANCRTANRPSFPAPPAPEAAPRLYEHFVSLARRDVPRVNTGVFGAMMDVSLVNRGPFTLCLDTDHL